MSTLALKSYQQAALATLSQFAKDARLLGIQKAYRELTGLPYANEPFGDTPCVCLRIPTGGGKTLLAAHAISTLATQWCATDAPVALWLVPSDAIRSQTLKALQSAAHPYRAALVAAYGSAVRVCTLDELSNIAPPEWGKQAVVVVATIQSFRIEDADKRNVYSFSERFERHFKSKPEQALKALHELPDAVVTPEEAAQDESGVLRTFVNQPRWSLANWLALHEPILIVDEAHNTKTDKSFTALKRLNPSVILELTATPLHGKANVLYHVSAQQLAAESMIKLPIALSEHPQGWQQAVFAAVQSQRALEAEAMKDEAAGKGHVRPMVLYQAQNENDEMPPEKLRDYLVNELHIEAAHIAIATGKLNELEGLDLNSRQCAIRHVITVQALREGWDCPFAYVLCSLQRLTGATAVEQLLGRVLRMPYASPRGRDALNRAYAHVCEPDFSRAANELKDRLINNMGFQALDVASMIAQQSVLPLFESPIQNYSAKTLEITSTLEGVKLTDELALLPGVNAVEVQGVPTVAITGHVDSGLMQALLAQTRGEKKRSQLEERLQQHNALVATQTAPAARGVVFAPLPTLAYRTDTQSELWPLDSDSVLMDVELDLLTPDAVRFSGYQVVEQSHTFLVDVKNQHVKYEFADESQIAFDYNSSSITMDDLTRWLDHSLSSKMDGFTQAQRLAYFTAVANYLVHDQGLTLVMLAKMRFKLAQDIESRVKDLRAQVAKTRFKQCVLNEEWEIVSDWQQPFVFGANQYPAPVLSRYAGSFEFKKHYYPVIANLKEGGEEFQCAQAIEAHASVKHWVRNLEAEPFGYSLPTSKGKTFPDFVAELQDGRLLIVEYKGAHLVNDPHEIEKRQVGELWAKVNKGRCVYAWIEKLKGGKTIREQLDAALSC